MEQCLKQFVWLYWYKFYCISKQYVCWFCRSLNSVIRAHGNMDYVRHQYLPPLLVIRVSGVSRVRIELSHLGYTLTVGFI